jgi:predicted phosphodiesterase
VWVTAGNMDFYLQNELAAATRNTNVTFEPLTAEVPIGNDQYLVATHGDDDYLLDELIQAGHFAYICHGHTHRVYDQMHNTSRVICPGSTTYPRGIKTPTATIIDTQENNVTFFDISTPATPLKIQI